MKRDALPRLDGAPPAAAQDARVAWRASAAALALVLVWLVAVYWPTAARIVATWARSETFAHGFVVPLIVGWLIWRSRAAWIVLTPAPSPAWLLPMMSCGLLWLCGEGGAVNALSQLAFVAMLVLAVPLVLGTAIARRLVFPLAFLFFAVPIGEFLMPTLMDWTADFTVAALRASGVPVYRDGQLLVIPTGRWSVVEACSGIRYLIASFMVGTLYAYLSFASLRRRLLFMGASIAIPIVANWVRAYLIVMMGHLSSNRLAVGVDHVIYGWLFFGFVMFLMFWVGSHWREPVLVPAPAVAEPDAPPPRRVRRGGLLAAICAGTLAWPLLVHGIDERIDAAAPVSLAPLPGFDHWQARQGGLDTWRPAITAPSAVQHEAFSDGAHEVGVYVAYFRHQSQDRKLVSSTNVLAGATGTGSGWVAVSGSGRDVIAGTPPRRVREVLLAASGERRLVARYWYWIDGIATPNPLLAKAYTFLSWLRGRDDGAIVVVYARADAAAGAALDAFLRDGDRLLEQVLQRTAQAR
jgi:exosortase A